MYYGEVFDSAAKLSAIDEDSERGFEPKPEKQEATCIAPRFTATSVDEFKNKYPTEFRTDHISEIFQEALSENSSVTVHSILNLVTILFVCIDAKNKEREGRISSIPPRMV